MLYSNNYQQPVAQSYTMPMEYDEPGEPLHPRPATDPVDLTPLITAIAQQNENNFAVFYDTTAARAYALILRITQSVPLAEEVMSDAYLQVWQQAQRFDPARGNGWAWLFMICRSRALDQLRRRDPAELHDDPDSLRDEFNGDNPLDLLLALDRNSAIHAAITQLAATERQLLALAFFRGLSHQEIADHSGMPLGSVKTVLRKAMLTLKDQLQQHAPTIRSICHETL